MKRLSLGLAALLTSTSAYALDSAGEIEEITVTATRTPISADSATTAITIISKEDLAKQQVFQLTDYLKTVPGVSISSSGSLGGQAQLRMRGAEANHTLVLIDGVEVNDPASGDEFQFEHLTSNEIERIEIIRSPMSSIWGSDAMGGVINIITRQASEEQSASAYAEYGSFDTLRTGGRISAAYGNWKLALGAGHMKSDGTNVSRSGDEMDGYENTNVNMRASIDITEGLSLAVTARHSDTTTEFDATDWMTGLPSDSDNVSDTKKTNLSANIKNSAFGGRLKSNLRLTYLDTEIASSAFGADAGSTAAEKVGFYFDNNVTLAPGHIVTLAIDHEKTDFTQAGEATFWGDPNQQQRMTNTGYLADYVGDITESFTLAGSVRHDKNSDYGDITSLRAGASYKVVEGTRLYANASTGQKAPTFIERFGYFTDSFIGNPDLNPEQSTGYEIGLEQAAGPFAISATYFNTNLTDEINGFYFDMATFNFTAVNKDGKSKRQGVEVTVDGDINDTLSFSTSYTYTDSTEDDGTGTQIAELRRPKHMASANFFAELGDRLNISASISHSGKALDVFYPPWPMPSERVELKSYTLARIAADFKVSDNISVYGRVENAFNSAYENVFGFATPNRSAYAGLRLAL